MVFAMSKDDLTPYKLHPEDVRVGATIREMRMMRGYTQDELSRAATISRPYLANIESGRKRPSMKAVARISRALAVPQVSIIVFEPDQGVAV